MHPQCANDKPPPRVFRQEMTDEVIHLIESGAAPWQQPWEGGETGMPMNPTTGKAYRGGNVLGLMISSMVRGYTDPRWMTFKQALDNGWCVRKGEKGTRIEYWEPKLANKADDVPEDEQKSRLIHRVYTVFNAQQIEGIPAIDIPKRKPFEVIEAAENVLKASGAEIRHGGSKAYYSPVGDYVQMPRRECFVDEAHYYSTCLHELAHWTGAKNRLDRTAEKGKFGSPEYAKEEIRADMASLFLSAELGIPFDPKDQAGYIANWIQVLKNDKNEVFRAASDASKICDFILGKDRAIETPAVEGPHAAAISASREPGSELSASR
jgi:antirestriction protein ArdC